MTDKEKLAEIFKKLPGIGPRQAKRMVFYLLTAPKDVVEDLISLVSNLQKSVSICEKCFRYFDKRNSNEKICSICVNSNRDREKLMVVSLDADFEVIEKSGVYKGIYFVLGGSIPFLAKDPDKEVRMKELLKILPSRIEEGLKEIIFALDATPEGEHTNQIVEKELKQFLNEFEKTNPENVIVISKLGRGLSTGTELEYSDKETIKNAISSRFLS